MALTGICLVLFVTFHVLMNAVAIVWPVAYNKVCLFLGANWYALIASAGLGLLVVLHIIYALVLTIQNRKARGNDRYSVSARPKSVEWSSQNMLVLGIVVIAFLGVHLVQFWARMQAQEVLGSLYVHDGVELPAAAGTLFLQVAFEQWYTPVIYIIGFVALWFHLNHGFWSMWQSIGWNNDNWMPRLKCIGSCWVSFVIGLFVLQVAVFTIRANQKYYYNNEALQAQYAEMAEEHFNHATEPIQNELKKIQQEAQALQNSGEMFTNPEKMQALEERFGQLREELQSEYMQFTKNLEKLNNLGNPNAAAAQEAPAAVPAVAQ